MGGKRIPWTTIKKKEDSQRLVLVVRETAMRTVGRNFCFIRRGLLETLSKISICEGRQTDLYLWGRRSGGGEAGWTVVGPGPGEGEPDAGNYRN